jgi:hypothetical protein
VRRVVGIVAEEALISIECERSPQLGAASVGGLFCLSCTFSPNQT